MIYVACVAGMSFNLSDRSTATMTDYLGSLNLMPHFHSLVFSCTSGWVVASLENFAGDFDWSCNALWREGDGDIRVSTRAHCLGCRETLTTRPSCCRREERHSSSAIRATGQVADYSG